MKQFLVHVVCDWQDCVEAETEEEAIDQIIDNLGNIPHDVFAEECEEDEEDCENDEDE